MGKRYEQKDNAYAPDSIAAHEPDTAKPLSVSDIPLRDAYATDTVKYDVVIGSPKNGKVAYKKIDSAWVILDSAETLKMLLWQVEQHEKLYK